MTRRNERPLPPRDRDVVLATAVAIFAMRVAATVIVVYFAGQPHVALALGLTVVGEVAPFVVGT